MNRRIVYLALGISIITTLLFTSCINVYPQPASDQTSSTEPASEGWDNQTTVIECPTEARVGEYITVRLRIGDREFWDWIRQQCIEEIGEYNEFCQDPFFSLYIHSKGGSIAYFGESKLDDNYEVIWYGPIPEAFDDGDPITPGVYPLVVEIGHALGSVDAIVERNITIKE